MPLYLKLLRRHAFPNSAVFFKAEKHDYPVCLVGFINGTIIIINGLKKKIDFSCSEAYITDVLV